LGLCPGPGYMELRTLSRTSYSQLNRPDYAGYRQMDVTEYARTLVTPHN